MLHDQHTLTATPDYTTACGSKVSRWGKIWDAIWQSTGRNMTCGLLTVYHAWQIFAQRGPKYFEYRHAVTSHVAAKREEENVVVTKNKGRRRPDKAGKPQGRSNHTQSKIHGFASGGTNPPHNCRFLKGYEGPLLLRTSPSTVPVLAVVLSRPPRRYYTYRTILPSLDKEVPRPPCSRGRGEGEGSTPVMCLPCLPHRKPAQFVRTRRRYRKYALGS